MQTPETLAGVLQCYGFLVLRDRGCTKQDIVPWHLRLELPPHQP